jgi:tRNA threonylcarbamoyladenosine biosynthesis protein TsaE
MDFTLLSSAPEETLELGRRLGRLLRGNELVLVSGELGAGKTVFIKGLAAALDIPSEEVVSPSFVLMNLYNGKYDLYHFDLYRLWMMPEALENPVDECIGAGVVAVEWAQYLDPGYFALANAVAVTIEAEEAGRRQIIMRSGLSYVNLA